jgi:hypothetical protein
MLMNIIVYVGHTEWLPINASTETGAVYTQHRLVGVLTTHVFAVEGI